MTYALIGCGRIARHHIDAVLANNLNIIALCDVDTKNAHTLAEMSNINPSFFTDYMDMLNSCKPDLVAIATPSGNHTKIALDCIAMGANVLIEKPVSLSIEDADEIIKAAKEKGVVVGACHQNRFNRSVQKLKEAVDTGRFGQIFHITANIRWNRNKNYYDQAKWRGTWAQDGGCLMNQCIHNIDLLRWIMGSEAIEVFSYTKNFCHPYIEAEDFGVGVVKFANGGIGIIEGTVNVFPKNLEETLYVFGERGTVKLGGASVNRIDEWIFEDGLDCLDDVRREFSETPPDVYGFGHTPLYRDLINAIKYKSEPSVTALEGKKSMELILAMYESSFEGKPIQLPLKNVSTLNYIGGHHAV
ncbi:MAG: Gfo/Idh/MocA family oxidoreductase [Defluviitaleaceae bacterium]|nr:Gfo/Idh/MocA family oxidoreductase [Defluviitaleaceae bacterium]